MKRFVLATLFIMAFCTLKAQNCEAIMLPYFGGDTEKLANYPEPKLQWRCAYSHNAFYVSDVIPEGAEIRQLGELKNKMTNQKLTEDFVVDLDNLSYYAYNFQELQLQYPKGNVTICFPTPKSSHAYLVLRSLDETYFRTEFPEKYNK